MKKSVPILLILFFLVLLWPRLSAADLVSDLQTKIDQTKAARQALLDEQQKLQNQIDQTQQEGRTLTGTIKTLDLSKKKLENDLKITNSKIVEKEDQIAIQEQAIKGTLSRLADYDAGSLVINLLADKNISEIWKDVDSLKGLENKLHEEIDMVKGLKTELESQKQNIVGQKTVVLSTQATKTKLLAETKGKEANYQKLLADNIAQEQQFESDLYNFESQLKITLDPSLIPAPRPSVLYWPLDKVIVTQRFGATVDSKRLYLSGTHNGVDFRASVGTPVKAVLAGVVQGQGNTDEQRGCYSYGRWILIRHANGLSTIYGHLSATQVQTGQKVATGDIIGLSGGYPGMYGSGYSIGPHLHLGLFATQGVNIEQFLGSMHCKQVFLPIAQPNAYLDPLAYLPAI